MLSRRRPIIIVGIIIVALGVLYALYQNYKRPEKVSWSMSFARQDKQPYGTYVVHQMLSKYAENRDVSVFNGSLKDVLPQKANNDSYIFINKGYATNPKDLDALMVFVENGGTAFIAAHTFPNVFFEKYGLTHCYDDGEDLTDSHSIGYLETDSVNMFLTPGRFNSDILVPFVTKYNFENLPYEWAFIEEIENNFCRQPDSDLTPIGFFDQHVNFARIKHGQGFVYIHVNPLVFTNWFALQDNCLGYIERVLSHLPKGKIYWDEHTATDPDRVNRAFEKKEPIEANYTNNDTPLRFILSQPSLAWSWYLSLIMMAFFIIFMGKRRQKIIPVLPTKDNTSLEFIKTIGQMYFQSSDFHGVCDMKLKQFQTFIRAKYGIQNPVLDAPELVQAVAQKSDVPEEHVRKIVLFEKMVENREITQDSMLALHHSLEYFYKKAT